MKRLLKKSLIKAHRKIRITSEYTLKVKDKVYLHKDKALNWSKRNKSVVIILTTLLLILTLIHYFDWWEVIGILFLKFGLGAKVTGAKTFARAVAKAGGTKAIAISTVSMLTKRHIIDISSKFFAEHSIEKYKKNLVGVFKIKLEEFKKSSIMKKIQAGIVLLFSIPGVYLFYTKVISVAIQKFVYALIVPLFTLVWTLIKGSFNFIGLIFEIIALNIFLEAISKYEWGKTFLKWIDKLVYLIGDLFNLLSKFLKWILSIFGIDFNPKSYLISKSLQLNRWLENIIDKGISRILKIERKRDRYINGVESISEKRKLFSQKKLDRKISFWKTFKYNFKKRVFKHKDWKELRDERCLKRKERIEKTLSYRRLEGIKNKNKKRKHALILPFHELVRYGKVHFRAR
jgi:hypothetical protein